jgi:hypothetical protein
MLVPLLITIPALLTSPGLAPTPVIEFRQEFVGEFRPHEHAALAAFERSVQDYSALHRQLARLTPRLQVTADPVQLRGAVDALGDEIRLVRHTAQVGDIFTPVVARMFRGRIHRALWNFDATALMAEMQEDAEPCAKRPVVNGRFPWSAGNAIWPSMLAALPGLPEELEYRFVGADLVLIDVPADLVVDILENALTSGT